MLEERIGTHCGALEGGIAVLVKISPRHAVTVDDDYKALLDEAPRQDFVVRTLAKRMVGNLPLMTAEVVIAGAATRERHPLAETYPLHFRKTYYPGRLRGDPRLEFESHTRASALVGVPPPIGYFGSTFRSCLLPGRPFDTLSAFGSEPEESNIKHASALSMATAAGLWRLAEELLEVLLTLQRGGMTHGDAELHNFIVCPSPLEVLPVDLDMAVVQDAVSSELWSERCERDLIPILRLAVFLQCQLGAQQSQLADLALARMHSLFTRSEPFARAIAERAGFTRAI